ncbi:MAG: MFS transporter, partial [Myxococcales bacterium]|nr:MFS transporter [Myxococcales bacterium]
MARTYLIAPDPKETGWPKGVPYIIGNEGCERFSYYGMRAILVLYMTNALMFDVARASTVYGNFTGLAYLMPLAGGYIADRW